MKMGRLTFVVVERSGRGRPRHTSVPHWHLLLGLGLIVVGICGQLSHQEFFD
jgi:hypothetical protein